jgi:hypothetical protein
MADIKIKIHTSADLAALEQTRAGTKGLEQDLSGITKETKAAKAPVEELGKASEKAGVSKKTLKEAIKALSHSVPELSNALLFLKNPFVIVAGAIAAAIAAVTSYIDSINRLAEAAKAHENIGRSFSAMGGAARDAKDSLSEFNKMLVANAEKAVDLEGKLTRVGDAIQRINRQEDEKRDAKEAFELEGVNADEKTNRISPREAMNRRMGIRSKFEQQREAAKRKQEEETIESKNEALRAQMEKRVKAEQELPAAEQEAARLDRLAKVDPKIAQSDAKFAADRLEELEKKKKKAEDSLYWSRFHAKPDPLTGVADPQALRRVQADEFAVGEIDSEIENARKQKDFAESRMDVGANKKRAEAASKRVQSIRDTITTGRDREGALFEDIVASKSVNESSRLNRAEVGGIKSRTTRVSEQADLDVQELRDAVEAQRAFIKAMKDAIKDLKTEFKNGQRDIESRRN